MLPSDARGIGLFPNAEAPENLREALELHFEPPVASHTPMVRHIEVGVGAA
jgi:hypothetical protein